MRYYLRAGYDGRRKISVLVGWFTLLWLVCGSYIESKKGIVS